MTGRESTWSVIALLVLSVTACNRQDSAAVEGGPDQTVPVSERSDAELATDVQSRFYADDLIRAGRIDVEAEDGVVTLRGSVQTEEARSRALEMARAVPGVTRVEDELQLGATAATAQPSAAAAGQGGVTSGVQGTSGQLPTPSVITTNIQARYFSNPAIRASSIEVNARPGGVVELRGEIGDMKTRNEALRIARETNGVVRVDDQLRVRGEPQQQPARDTGAATTDSTAPGATATTGAGATGDAAAPGGSSISDTWLTAQVQSKYYLDDDIRGRDIDVTTENAIVTLTGTVDSAQERRQAVALARNTDGVRDVRDQLTVTQAAAQQPQARTTLGVDADGLFEDGWITTKVQSQYFLDPQVKGHEINVDTRNGVVTLKGTVDSNQQKQLAEQIARETEGVTRVVNQVTVTQ